MEPNSIFLPPISQEDDSWHTVSYHFLTRQLILKNHFLYILFPATLSFFYQSNSSRGYLSAIQKGHKWLEEKKKKTLNHSDHSTWYKWLRPCHPPICPLSAAQLSWHALPALSNPNLLPSLPPSPSPPRVSRSRPRRFVIYCIRSLLGSALDPGETHPSGRLETRCDQEPPQETRARAGGASCWPHTLGVGTSDDVA